MKDYIFITGASGLLGRQLVKRFSNNGFFVFAHYCDNLPEERNRNCEWIRGDFSLMEGIQDFLVENCLQLKPCGYLINNYGPITYKSTAKLCADDFYNDFHHNVVTAFEITDFFLKHTAVQRVMNIGFQGIDAERPFKKILPYAMAKNALRIMTSSMAAAYPDIEFQFFSPPTMKGAQVAGPGVEPVPPHVVANEIHRLLTH